VNSEGIGFSDKCYRKILFDNQSVKWQKAGMRNPPFLYPGNPILFKTGENALKLVGFPPYSVCAKFSGGRCPPEPPRLGNRLLIYAQKMKRPRGNGALKVMHA